VSPFLMFSKFATAAASRQVFARSLFRSYGRPFSEGGGKPPPPAPPPPRRVRNKEKTRAAPGAARGGARKGRRGPVQSKNEISWAGVAATGVVAGVGVGGLFFFQNPALHNDTDILHPKIAAFVDETADTFKNFFEDADEPIRRKLLPDFPKNLKLPGGQDPPTLVLDLDDTLIHVDWDRRHGYRVAKRPGVDKFLDELSMYFEVVIFTDMGYGTADEILFSLDPNRYVHHRLYSDSARKVKGKFIKDLSYLNRDLSRVIVVEKDPKAVPDHQDNAIFVKRFNPKEPDEELKLLLPFLKAMATNPVGDFRSVLNAYGHEDIGKRYAEQLREHQAKQAERRSKGLSGMLKKRREAAPMVTSAARGRQEQSLSSAAATPSSSNTASAASSVDTKSLDAAGAAGDGGDDKKKGGLWSWFS
jgi:hypothetical protein